MPRYPQLSWTSGEIAGELQGRIDQAKYAGGANLIINFIPRLHGALERRPGTQYLGPVKDDANAPRIERFVFRNDQAYVLEFGDQYMRVWMLGGRVFATTPNYLLTTLAGDRITTIDTDGLITLQVDPTASPYEIVTPWPIAYVPQLQVVQVADIMWIFHPYYEPRTLTRTAHSSWTLEKYQPTGGPFLERNDTAITMTPSSTTVGASITLTASAAYFDADMVGALFRIEEYDTNGYSMWEPGKAYAGSALVRYGANTYQTSAGGTSGAVAPVHLEGTRYDGQIATACQWTYLHSGYGVCRITAFTSSLIVQAEVISTLPSTSATVAWREGAWSPYRGWPAAVVAFQQRLWAAATASNPQTVWGTVGGNFFDMTPGDLDDDAVVFTLAARDANPIRTLSEGRALYLHTSQRTFQCTGAQGGPITPADIRVIPIAGQGANGVQAANVDRVVLLVSSSGTELLELGFDLEADEDSAIDLTRWATHIMAPGG